MKPANMSVGVIGGPERCTGNNIDYGSNLLRSMLLLIGYILSRVRTMRVVSMLMLPTDGGRVPGLRLRSSYRGAR